jgi:hypothetical protein
VWVGLALRGRTLFYACHRPRRTRSLPKERESMFYVILIVVAIIIGVALFFVRGRRSV